jgi:hypothetical protein
MPMMPNKNAGVNGIPYLTFTLPLYFFIVLSSSSLNPCQLGFIVFLPTFTFSTIQSPIVSLLGATFLIKQVFSIDFADIKRNGEIRIRIDNHIPAGISNIRDNAKKIIERNTRDNISFL